MQKWSADLPAYADSEFESSLSLIESEPIKTQSKTRAVRRQELECKLGHGLLLKSQLFLFIIKNKNKLGMFKFKKKIQLDHQDLFFLICKLFFLYLPFNIGIGKLLENKLDTIKEIQTLNLSSRFFNLLRFYSFKLFFKNKSQFLIFLKKTEN